MPQPFTFDSRSGGQIVTGLAAMEARPEFAHQIALVSSHWSMLEWRLTSIFLALLKGQQDVALAVYHVLVDRRLRQDAIVAALEARLDREIAGKAQAAFGKIGAPARERNRIIHSTWCAIDSHPDRIFRRDDRQVDRMLFDNDALLRQRMEAARAGRPNPSLGFGLSDPLELEAYTANDFSQVITRIEEARTLIEGLASEVSRRTT